MTMPSRRRRARSRGDGRRDHGGDDGRPVDSAATVHALTIGADADGLADDLAALRCRRGAPGAPRPARRLRAGGVGCGRRRGGRPRRSGRRRGAGHRSGQRGAGPRRGPAGPADGGQLHGDRRRRSDDGDAAALGRVAARGGDGRRRRCVLVTVAPHAFDGSEPAAPGAGTTAAFVPELDPALARTLVRDRVERVAGVTLATAPVVVGGGRGVGSAEAFAPLEELADAARRCRRLLPRGHQQRLAQPHATRSARPARGSPRPSTWPVASPARSSTGSARWPPSTSSP